MKIAGYWMSPGAKRMKNNIRVLLFLSYATSAPIMACMAFIALALLDSAGFVHALASIVFSSVLPVANIIFFAKRERVDYNIPERSTRLKPFVFAIACYVLGFLALLLLKAPVLMTCMMVAYVINTSAMFLITLFWKISIHTAGVTGPITYLVYALGWQWSFLYLLVIPVGVVKLLMKQHSVSQLVAGAILSAVLSWMQIIFILPALIQYDRVGMLTRSDPISLL